jgi:hypothetical protein
MDRAELLNDHEETSNIMLEGHQAGVWTAIPAIVTKVNFSQMTVEAQPSIKGITENENGTTEYVPLPLLVDVPLIFPSAGGFMLTLPIAAGDEVLILFASRCIDAWWQSGGIGVPMELRMHDLSDGFALPGPRSLPKLPSGSVSTTDAQLRNDSGTAVIGITAGGQIKLVASAGIVVTGGLVVTGEVTANGIPLSTHHHPGVQTGGGVTGAPTP